MANLSVDFKDDILASSNPKRKYQLIHNSDGTVSLEDVTVYQQNGSNFGAKEVNEERTAINKINNDRIVSLDEIDLVNQPGFFVDALAVKELNSTLKRERFSISPTSSEVSVKVRFSSKFNKVPTVVVTPTFQSWRLSKPIQVSDITTDGFTATAWIENGATSSDTWITVEYVAVAT